MASIPELRAALADIQPPADNAPLVPVSQDLKDRYQKARDTYLERRIQHAFLERIRTATLNEEGQLVVEPVETPDVEAVQERRRVVEEKVQSTCALIRDRMQEIQSKTAVLLARKQALEEAMDDLNNVSFDAENVEVPEDTVTEEQLTEMREQHIRLTQQLQQVRDETLRTEKRQQELQRKLRGIDTSNLAQLQAENADRQKEIDQYREIADFYNNLRLVMEKLSGIRVLNVQTNEQSLLLSVQLASVYTAEVRLEAQHNACRVREARWTCNTTLTGPPVESPMGETQPPISMQIPGWDDLVQTAQQLPPGDDLRWILPEGLHRAKTTQARIDELSALQSQVLLKVGDVYPDSQEVVCSLPKEQLTLVLRLWPDCPTLDDSVLIQQLVGVGGWDANYLQQLQDELSSRTFRSPSQVIAAVQDAVKERKFPETPKWPARTGF